MKPRDIEADFVSRLRSALPGLSVSTRVPNPRPSRFVRVSRAGGQIANIVEERLTVIVECWANSGVDAFELAQDVWGVLRSAYATGAAPAFGSMSSPVPFDDPETSQSRYQFTVSPLVPLEV